MIISISGKAGSGKTTVAELLAKELNFKSYYMGGLRRLAAKKRGMSLEAYNKLGETDPTTDAEVDEYQRELGQKEDNFIIQGRTSFHFIPHSIKIYLDVEIQEAAKRILSDSKNDERNEVLPNTVEEKIQNLKERDASDKKRYEKHYGFDFSDQTNYDLIIDTTNISAQEVANIILKYLEEKEFLPEK